MRLQEGRAIRSAKISRCKYVRYKNHMSCEKCIFDHVIYMSVNNVFPPDVRDPLLESGTAQQRPVSAACPVLHAFVNGVPTQVLLDTGSVVSGVSEKFLRANKKYFRTVPSLPINQFYIRLSLIHI